MVSFGGETVFAIYEGSWVAYWDVFKRSILSLFSFCETFKFSMAFLSFSHFSLFFSLYHIYFSFSFVVSAAVSFSSLEHGITFRILLRILLRIGKTVKISVQEENELTKPFYNSIRNQCSQITPLTALKANKQIQPSQIKSKQCKARTVCHLTTYYTTIYPTL